ncbi:type I restriction endonuclease subunit R [soil metagenome]
MTAVGFTESVVELAALQWLGEIGYSVLHGPDISPGGLFPERDTYQEVVLRDRLKAALARINPDASPDAIEDAMLTVGQVGQPSLVLTNRAFHTMLVDGVSAEVLRDGEQRGELVRLVDFDQPDNNEFVAVNQFTVVGETERRPDIVIFVNGLPLAVLELKNMGDEKATIDQAYRQLQTYQAQIPQLFHSNELLLISDGNTTELGCVTTPKERFAAWKTIDGDELLPSATMEVAIRGVFAKRRFLDLIGSFIVFEDDGKTIQKKVAQYHQFHAVQKALGTALRATGTDGDGKGGVLWHTQGSGKSLTMLFFAGKLIVHPVMANPTIVMITDRTDLDSQLFGVFARGAHVLRQKPVQAESRTHLRQLLSVNAGGVIFTTIQNFFPEDREDEFPLLSDRRNIVVMADEAHRTQYGFDARMDRMGKFAEGFAQHMRTAVPNATFVAFTGTPLDLTNRSTRLVFGDYIDIYDVGRAIADGATVPIHYESRLVRLDMPEGERDVLDEGFEGLTEDQEEAERVKLTSKWAQLEAVVGTQKRLGQIAADIVEHSGRRQEALAGKVMIVTMSRRIAVDLYDQLIALRPEWHGASDADGVLKVVMTGNATDKLEWQTHIRNKDRREKLADRFKDPDDPFRIVIVRDMWLTGFDAPSLHTIYIDKPMKGHGLMQAIARVNRVFKDKPGGLVVDYLGIAHNLKEALRTYLRDDPGGKTPIENVDAQSEDIEFSLYTLVGSMIEYLELCRDAFNGFNYELFLTGSQTERLQTVARAQDFLIQRDYREGRVIIDRFLDHTTALVKAFALASSTPEAQKIKREIAFFQTVKAALSKTTGRSTGTRDADLDHAIRQLVDKAIAPEGVVDVFAAAGLEKPDISIISDAFLAEVRDMKQENLALELLKKLLNDEITATKRTSVVQSRKFSDKLQESIMRYHNRALETAQVIEALIALAQEMQEASSRGEKLGMLNDEVAFYDALGENDSAAKVMADDQLKIIAQEVADTVRNNTSIDWRDRQQARANLRRLVRRVLRRYGYPPDQQDSAVVLIIEQAEALAALNA